MAVSLARKERIEMEQKHCDQICAAILLRKNCSLADVLSRAGSEAVQAARFLREEVAKQNEEREKPLRPD